MKTVRLPKCPEKECDNKMIIIGGYFWCVKCEKYQGEDLSCFESVMK